MYPRPSLYPASIRSQSCILFGAKRAKPNPTQPTVEAFTVKLNLSASLLQLHETRIRPSSKDTLVLVDEALGCVSCVKQTQKTAEANTSMSDRHLAEAALCGLCHAAVINSFLSNLFLSVVFTYFASLNKEQSPITKYETLT